MAPANLRHSVLSGPPGTGKTLISGALARSAGWRFCSASIGEWFTTSDGNLGGVSRTCAGFFDRLLAQDCTIGFLDELDSLPSRNTSEYSSRGLLPSLVSFHKLGVRNPYVLVMAVNVALSVFSSVLVDPEEAV